MPKYTMLRLTKKARRTLDEIRVLIGTSGPCAEAVATKPGAAAEYALTVARMALDGSIEKQVRRERSSRYGGRS